MVYYLKCLQCCKTRSLRQKHRDDLKLNEGIRKISKDLDISHLIKRIKDVEMLIKVDLSRNERFLMNHQRNLVIDSSDCCSSNVHSVSTVSSSSNADDSDENNDMMKKQ